MNASETNYKEYRQSHANVFVPHHLGSVKGSSPDLNPLIYLFILDIVSQTSSHNQEETNRQGTVVSVKYRAIERLKSCKYVRSVPPCVPRSCRLKLKLKTDNNLNTS